MDRTVISHETNGEKAMNQKRTLVWPPCDSVRSWKPGGYHRRSINRVWLRSGLQEAVRRLGPRTDRTREMALVIGVTESAPMRSMPMMARCDCWRLKRQQTTANGSRNSGQGAHQLVTEKNDPALPWTYPQMFPMNPFLNNWTRNIRIQFWLPSCPIRLTKYLV